MRTIHQTIISPGVRSHRCEHFHPKPSKAPMVADCSGVAQSANSSRVKSGLSSVSCIGYPPVLDDEVCANRLHRDDFLPAKLSPDRRVLEGLTVLRDIEGDQDSTCVTEWKASMITRISCEATRSANATPTMPTRRRSLGIRLLPHIGG